MATRQPMRTSAVLDVQAAESRRDERESTCGSLHPSGTAAEVSAALSFVILRSQLACGKLREQ
jgi:hypothetical protein